MTWISSLINKNVHLYCKRKYYFAVCSFYKVKEMSSDQEEEFEKIEALITSTKILIKKKMKNAVDLIIMMSLYSSYAWMISRKLISSERDLKSAIQSFKRAKHIVQEDRIDIPIIPNSVLKQRIVFQRGLLLIAYGKHMKAAMMFTKLLKIGKIYDPLTRYDTLRQLKDTFTKHFKVNQSELQPQLKNIDMMIQLFSGEM